MTQKSHSVESAKREFATADDVARILGNLDPTKMLPIIAVRPTSYRQRMRAAGLRPVQIWVPDTRGPDFVEVCCQQARAVAAHDPAGDEIMRFVADVYQWPEP
jgi:Protein  of unknown function (DUF3018)